MSEATFRSGTQSQPVPEVLPVGKDAAHTGDNIPVPYTEYQKSNGKPFSAEYFGLGDSWNDPVGGYPKEIATIEGFINEKIENGEYPNTIEAIKSRLRGLEKLVALEKDERTPIKIETLTAYIKFMSEKDNIRRNASIYGHH